MTVDGAILETLIRDLIGKEFKVMIAQTKNNADDIKRVRT